MEILKKATNTILQAAAKKLLVESQHGKAELADFRIGECENCPLFDSKERVCLACGCFMDIKKDAATHRNLMKNRIEITHCPNGKWGDKPIANIYRTIDNIPLLE